MDNLANGSAITSLVLLLISTCKNMHMNVYKGFIPTCSVEINQYALEKVKRLAYLYKGISLIDKRAKSYQVMERYGENLNACLIE
jgi:hypothetical protein